MNVSNELKLQLSLIGIKYELKDIPISDIKWQRFFIEASNNRILYHCCKKILDLSLPVPEKIRSAISDNILPKGKSYIEKTKRALLYLLEKLPPKKYEFLTCKTQKIFDYITFDVDCLFRKSQYEETLKYLHSLGGKRVACEKKLQADIIMPNMIRMDMHDGFHWHQSEFIPVHHVWEKTETKTVFGVKNCDTPSINNEVILTFLNLIYERHYIPLLDYHYVFHNKDKLDWKYIISIAKNNGWKKDFLSCFTNLISFIYLFVISFLLISNSFILDISAKNYEN